MIPTVAFCRNRHGHRLAYTKWGTGPVLVIPSPWISHLELQWDDVGVREIGEWLAQRYETVWYDKRGTGLSDRERDDFSLADELADLETVVDEVTKRPIALFGMSMGGPLSIAYAAAHPERVTHLVLYGSYASGADIAPLEVRDSLVRLVRASWGLGAEALASILAPFENDPRFHTQLRRFQREAASGEAAARMLEAAYSWDISDVLAQVRAPTLVIHRHKDRAIPSQLGIELASKIPNARLALLEGEIHCGWAGDWERVAELVEGFVPTERTAERPAVVAAELAHPARRYETLNYDVQDQRERSQFRIGVAQIGEQDDLFTPGPTGLFRLPAPRVPFVQRKVHAVLGEAAEHGVNLLVFPEMCLDLNIRELEADLAELSHRYDIDIVAGGYHDEVTRANVCKVIGRNGVLWQQRKHIPAILSLSGQTITEPIEAPTPHISVVATTCFGRIAIAICRDFLDLDLLVELRNAEPPVDVVINPAFTPVTADFSAAHLGARRALYVCTVFCNHASFGESEIFSPEKRRRRVHVGPGKEAVIYRDIPLFDMRAERRAWDERTHRRFIQSTRAP